MSRMADFYITQNETVERVADNLKANCDPSEFEPENLVRSIRASIEKLQGVLANLDPADEIQFECFECEEGSRYTLDQGTASVFLNGEIEFFCLEHE